MRFSIYTSIRLLSIGFLACSTLAVALGRMAPNRYAKMVVDHRQPWTVAQHMIDPARGRNLILQTGRDRRIEMDFGEGSSVDLLSVSPFVDAKGRREMVGRRRLVQGTGTESIAVRVEMSRYSYPEGELIESRETDWIPNSIPAWDVRLERGLKSVFSTGAGFLVRMDWTDARGLTVSHGGERIDWLVEPPLGESMNIGDPVWVSDPKFPDRLIVNFWGQDEETHENHVGIAWIELNRDRSGIVDIGVLARRNLGARKNAISMRSPSVRLDPSGTLHVLWMEREEAQRHWRLNMAELTQGPADGSNEGGWRLSGTHQLAEKCMPVPAFLDESLRYAYFVVPRSLSCYDGGEWRKAFLGESQGMLALRNDPGGTRGFETVSRR